MDEDSEQFEVIRSTFDESLCDFADRFEVPVKILQEENPFLEDVVHIGDEVKCPISSPIFRSDRAYGVERQSSEVTLEEVDEIWMVSRDTINQSPINSIPKTIVPQTTLSTSFSSSTTLSTDSSSSKSKSTTTSQERKKKEKLSFFQKWFARKEGRRKRSVDELDADAYRFTVHVPTLASPTFSPRARISEFWSFYMRGEDGEEGEDDEEDEDSWGEEEGGDVMDDVIWAREQDPPSNNLHHHNGDVVQVPLPSHLRKREVFIPPSPHRLNFISIFYLRFVD